MKNKEDFVTYLRGRLDALGWSQRRLSRLSTVSTTSINELLKNTQELTAETATRLASVPELETTSIDLLRMAGKLDQPQTLTARSSMIAALFEALSPSGQESIIELMQMRLDKERRAQDQTREVPTNAKQSRLKKTHV